MYSKTITCVSEVILTLFSPFDIKCKKHNAKNFWKCIFRASRRMSFSIFPRLHLIIGDDLDFLFFVKKSSRDGALFDRK